MHEMLLSQEIEYCFCRVRTHAALLSELNLDAESWLEAINTSNTFSLPTFHRSQLSLLQKNRH